MPLPDPDDTIRIRPEPQRARRARRVGVVVRGVVRGVVLGAVLAGAGAVGWFTRSPPPAPPPVRTAESVMPTASEAEILASSPTATEARRFTLQPEIVVLHFATLADQARTLNRAAALLERAGFPRDRVVDDAELDTRIRASGEKPETLYYGHDYSAADLLRFFAAADRAGQTLTPNESRLRHDIQSWGWREGTTAALISLVRDDPSAGLDPSARATILRHELSHGLYFTSPAYAAYARQFWAQTLTEAERGLFRSFLAAEGYDTTLAELMVNETQAYLMHTPDLRFFSATAIGIEPERLAQLRALFLADMPPSWLRDATASAVKN